MSESKAPNIEFVLQHDAVMDDTTGKWRAVIKIDIHVSWSAQNPIVATSLYHPQLFDTYAEADAFAKQFGGTANV